MKFEKETKRCQFFSSSLVASGSFLERPERWDRTSSGKIALCSHLRFDLISPTQNHDPGDYFLHCKTIILTKISCFSAKIPWNSGNKPQGLCFSRALFERLIFGGAFIRRGLSTEGNLGFKINWASLIVESRFTVFALFYFVFEDNFPGISPGGLIFGGAI